MEMKEFSHLFSQKNLIKSFSVLKPIPPIYFGTQGSSQLSLWIFLLSFVDLHQKLAIAKVRFLQVILGNLKQLIAWIGIAKAKTSRLSPSQLEKEI